MVHVCLSQTFVFCGKMTEQWSYGMFLLNKADILYRYQRYKQQSLGRIPTSNLTPPYFFSPCAATGVGLEIPPGKIKRLVCRGVFSKNHHSTVPNRHIQELSNKTTVIYRKENMTQEKSHWFPTTKRFSKGSNPSSHQESSFGALPPLEETAGTTQRLALPSPQTEVWTLDEEMVKVGFWGRLLNGKVQNRKR